MKNKKSSQGVVVLLLMAGVFVTLIGLMEYMRSVDNSNIAIMVGGLALVGIGVYRLIAPGK